MPDIFKPTQEQAQEAGAICGALLFGYLWQLQQETVPHTIPMQRASGRKYISAKEAGEILGIRKSKFYDLRSNDKDFPKTHATAGGEKYLASEIDRYNKKLQSKKA